MRALIWIGVSQILCTCQSERKMMKLKSEDNCLSLEKFDYKKTEHKKSILSFHYFKNDADK